MSDSEESEELPEDELEELSEVGTLSVVLGCLPRLELAVPGTFLNLTMITQEWNCS